MPYYLCPSGEARALIARRIAAMQSHSGASDGFHAGGRRKARRAVLEGCGENGAVRVPFRKSANEWVGRPMENVILGRRCGRRASRRQQERFPSWASVPYAVRENYLLLCDPYQSRNLDAVERWFQRGDVVLTIVANDLGSGDGQSGHFEATIVDAEVKRIR